jgi:hypothetical protein
MTSSVENWGIFITLDRSPISWIAVPSATSAEASGIVIANSDPNTRNRTMPAVTIPRPVPPIAGSFAHDASCPETAITTPSPDGAVAVPTKSFA